MKQFDVKVSFYLKKSEADEKGCCPVMAKLTVGRYSETAFSLKMSVPKTMWNSGRATGKSVAARVINRRLKIIAVKCGIERRLVFHCLRHNFATHITLSMGVPLETVSRMLGHAEISTTQIYAKVTDDKINADTRSFDSRIRERFSISI